MSFSNLRLTMFAIALFAAPFVHAGEGGISGGGGGTLPLDPISKEEVKSIIENRRFELVLIFNDMDVKRSLPPAISAKLFDVPFTIQDVAKQTKVEINFDNPCVAPDGTKNDGAAPGSTEDSVCMSAFTIAPKVGHDQARPEILALLAHEFSHLLGTNEPEAIEIQRRVLSALNSKRAEEIDNGLRIYRRDLEAVPTYFPDIKAELSKWQENPGYSPSLWQLGAFKPQIFEGATDLDDSNFAVYPRRILQFKNSAVYRAESMRLFLSSAPEDQRAFNRVWGDSDQLPLDAFLCRMTDLSSVDSTRHAATACVPQKDYPVGSGFVVKKTTDASSMLYELEAIEQAVEVLDNELKSVESLRATQ